MRNSRKQHTINVLFHTRLSPEFISYVENIKSCFPGESQITVKEIEDNPDANVKEAVRFLLNYYEFIAVGVRHGDLDIKLIRDCLCTQFCIFIGPVPVVGDE